MEEKLKPCPLCGSDEVKLVQPPHQNYIECLECEATGPNLPTDEDAIAAWNRREPHAKLVAALKAIRECHDLAQARLQARAALEELGEWDGRHQASGEVDDGGKTCSS